MADNRKFLIDEIQEIIRKKREMIKTLRFLNKHEEYVIEKMEIECYEKILHLVYYILFK